MTPKGVADVLSEADFERLIAALIEDGFPRAAKLLRADRRALALHCSEQEERVEKAEALANAFKDEMDWAIEDAAKAEARCVELEAALAKIRAEVDKQAEDEALWALNLDGSLPISEAYLQQELRTLHAVIESVDGEREDPRADHYEGRSDDHDWE